MDRRAKVELFEQIRGEYEHGEGTTRGVGRKFGVHRRMVRQALASALPPERKRPERPCPRLGPVKEFIDGILEADRKAPRKQRHTAHRIWERLRTERPECPVAESTVRRYVGRQKQEMGCTRSDRCVTPHQARKEGYSRRCGNVEIPPPGGISKHGGNGREVCAQLGVRPGWHSRSTGCHFHSAPANSGS